MKKAISIVSLLVCLAVILCACGGSGLSGTYKGDGDISEIKFSGGNKVAIKMESAPGISMTGTYAIKDGEMTINYSFTLFGEKAEYDETYSFEQKDNKTIVIDGQELKK